ncbi:MAG: hypothetical protein ACTS1Z_02910 [Parasphingopyxis sp.]|uniref:hypothetical protein n=1 Tax=Parasphingopyxis sp. TaxID=1920299 RepID=UPI003F9F351F
MRKTLIGLGFLLAAHSVPSYAQIATDEQLRPLVKAEEQFRQFLLMTVMRTQTSAMAVRSLGLTEYCSVLSPLFEDALAEGLPRWENNLIQAHRDNIPAETLAAAVDMPEEQRRQLLASYAATVGNQMQRESTSLLQQSAMQIIPAIGEAASSVDPSSVDEDARMAEIQAAMADGSILCGLDSGAQTDSSEEETR